MVRNRYTFWNISKTHTHIGQAPAAGTGWESLEKLYRISLPFTNELSPYKSNWLVGWLRAGTAQLQT